MPTAIKVENLSFFYPEKTCALENVSFTIETNAFVGIIGPNGGGKTTLLRLLLGFLTPQKGTIEIFHDRHISNNKNVSYVPQFATFNSAFPITVKQMLLMGTLKNFKIRYEKKDLFLLQETMQKLDILPLQNKIISELSGGELQRVLLARALICQPKILLLDEPTASADIHNEKNIFDLLKNLNDEGMTILVVSHDIGFISDYIESIICVNKHVYKHETKKLNKSDIYELYQMPVEQIIHRSLAVTAF